MPFFGLMSLSKRSSPGDFGNCVYEYSRYHPFLLKNKLKSFPGQNPSTFLSRSFETAYEHAKQLISRIDVAKATGCRVYIAFYSYASAFAGSILALRAPGASKTLCFEADSLQQKNIAFLEELGRRWNHTPNAVS